MKRQQALARRMAEALDRVNRERGGAQHPPECPDTEIIAAYAEQALDPVESAKWEGHFAACARCRNILRVLSVSADAPLAEQEVAHIGELVASAAPARQPVQIPAASAERSRPQPVDWRVRWFAPAMAVAAVLLVWFSVRPPWRATEQGSTTTLVAQAPKQEIPQNHAPSGADQSVQVAPQQNEQNEKVQAMPPAATSSAPPPFAPANPPAEFSAKRKSNATAALDSVAPNSNAMANARGDFAKDEKKLGRMAEPRPKDAQPLGTPSAAPPPPIPQMRAPSAAPAAPPAEEKSSTSASAASAPAVQTESAAISPQNAPAADKQAGALQSQAGAANAAAAQGSVSASMQPGARKEQPFAVARSQQRDAGSLLKAPSGLVHYRAGRVGMIERSVDAGKTWIRQNSPLKEDWLAASSPTDAVCWLAGRHGAIARTVDGQHWERVAPPAQAAASDGSMPDWTGISVADSQTAGITAADGRRFATGDGGKTWQSQQ